jgi:tetratricopeptide (TPR) repeat protein
MKHPRHPYTWRANAARATLLFGTLVAACTSPAFAAKSEPAPAADVADAPVAPGLDLFNREMPQLLLPSLDPTMPSIGPALPSVQPTQAPQLSATRRAHELKVTDYQRNRAMRTSHGERIDYVDALIHLERYNEAIEELDAIEQRYPEAYINAHLLGIASERSGNLEAARRWFETAVKRDPEAQEGTGWLRIAMIEAQLALRKDPAWLSKHSVLDGAAGRSEEDLIRAMEVQVHQRRDSFAEHDPVIADLYFQIGARVQQSETRDTYFALSMETHPLRQQDIEGQLVIRAHGAAPALSSH